RQTRRGGLEQSNEIGAKFVVEARAITPLGLVDGQGVEVDFVFRKERIEREVLVQPEVPVADVPGSLEPREARVRELEAFDTEEGEVRPLVRARRNEDLRVGRPLRPDLREPIAERGTLRVDALATERIGVSDVPDRFGERALRRAEQRHVRIMYT